MNSADIKKLARIAAFRACEDMTNFFNEKATDADFIAPAVENAIRVAMLVDKTGLLAGIDYHIEESDASDVYREGMKWVRKYVAEWLE